MFEDCTVLQLRVKDFTLLEDHDEINQKINQEIKSTVESSLDSIAKNFKPLLELYTMTNGDRWYRRANWFSSSPICVWYGVKNSSGCEYSRGEQTDNVIVNIMLKSNNLCGKLPSTYPNKLQKLDLSENALTGCVPTTLPSTLINLDLSSNKLDSFTRLPPKLKTLNISQNKISEIPDKLPSTLITLDLSQNEICECESTVFVGLSLDKLKLGSNKLERFNTKLPRSLTNLELEGNKLKEFPEWLPNNLQALLLDRNELEGRIPEYFPD
eukprot:UN24816